MNEFFISITKDGTKKFPLHQHPKWEIMYYLSGSGYLRTETDNVPFEPGSIIVVPPKIIHGSASQDGFVNISIGGDFNNLFQFDRIISQKDNAACDGERLARLIFENRHGDNQYLSSLCNAYVHFLLINAHAEKEIAKAVNRIIGETTSNFSDSEFNITEELNKSGYAEDYIRAEFKKVTNMTPIDFLTKIRIDHAIKLIEIYGKSIFISEVAAACGFDDPAFFSRRFKKLVGYSPNEYKKIFTAKAE